MTNIQQSLEKETNQSLLHNKSGNFFFNTLKASKNTIADLNLAQDGDSTLPPGRRIHLRQRIGNKAATGSQIEAGIRGNHLPGLISIFSSLLLAIDGVCRRAHLQRTTFFHAQFLRSCFVVLLSECTVAH